MARKASSSSICQCRKCGDREKTKDEDVEDKISKIPDEILCHILSFIPTTEAVRTAILSRRWRYVGISAPCIELYSGGPFHHISDFPYLVDKLLCLKKMYFLRKFSLRWNDGMFNTSRVNEWISNAITQHSVEVLELMSNHCYEVPHSIFTSKKLATLKLGWSGTRLNVPVSVCLPSLKIIHLHSVRLCNDDSMRNLLHGCPVLEELDVNGCTFADHMTTMFVRSPSLKRLYFSTPYYTIKETELLVVIDAPNLQLLHIRNKMPEILDVKYLSSLVVVDSPGQALLNTPPTFRNLTDLCMRGVRQNGGHVLPCLLECSPNLKRLRYGESYRLQCREPKCLMLYLEKITIDDFKGGPVEMKMVMYFLKNAPVLKKMLIYSKLNSKEDPKIHEKVSVLPRTSTVCQIEYQGYWEFYSFSSRS